MPDSEQFDVVIVGAGAGGGAMAWALSNRSITPQPMRLLLLDAGPAFDPAKDYPAAGAQWETAGFPEKPGSKGEYSFGDMQALDPEYKRLRSWNRLFGRYNSGDRRMVSGPGYYHVRGLGGSTLHYTGEAHRINPHAMRMQSRFGVAADWPFDYDELEADYAAVEKLIGVAGPAEQPDRWRSGPFPLPPHPLSPASRKLGEAFRKLGMQWQPNSRTALSRPYDGRPDCNYCGQCTRGCPRRDKGSTDLTFIAKARSAGGVEIRANCQVTRLIATTAGHVDAVEYVDPQGKRQRATGKAIVLAGGAIETPRLLLASAGDHAPHGIANESGQVGRNLMETLSWNSSAVVDDRVASFAGLPSDAICWDFNRPDAIGNVIGGCRFSTTLHEAELDGPVAYATRVVPGWGRNHKQAMRKAFGRVLTVGSIGEFLPNADTFIDLDPAKRDAHGMALARIHSHLAEPELKRLQFMAKTCRRVLAAAGASELFEEYGSHDLLAMTHVFGTCRMGLDARHSVVDADCRAHYWKNLYISDASLFPSSGGGESPSLTIHALALRAARAVSKSIFPRN